MAESTDPVPVEPLQVTAEFTIEPFVEGDPGVHVLAGLAAVRAAGLEPDIGPFGSAVTGELAEVTRAVSALLLAATEAGATRLSLQLSVLDDTDGAAAANPD